MLQSSAPALCSLSHALEGIKRLRHVCRCSGGSAAGRMAVVALRGKGGSPCKWDVDTLDRTASNPRCVLAFIGCVVATALYLITALPYHRGRCWPTAAAAPPPYRHPRVVAYPPPSPRLVCRQGGMGVPSCHRSPDRVLDPLYERTHRAIRQRCALNFRQKQIGLRAVSRQPSASG